jgi:hypothetical protein
MPFSALTSGEIATAEPVASTMLTKVKDNFDDHEDRIQTLESTFQTNLPIILRVNGLYIVQNGVIKTTANSNITIDGVRILIDGAGTAGSTEIDIKRKRGGGAFTSIFTVKPTISYTAGNDALSTAGTLDPTMVDIEAGDILKLDITAAQTHGVNFLVRIDWTGG